MLKGFRDFIVRGNVLELAVGFVMGVAFSGVVTQFTRSFLEPLIKWVSGGRGITAGAIEVREGVVFDWSAFINAVLTFLLTAAVLYFLVVMPVNRFAERRKRGEEPPPEAPSEEVQLLTEIRDLLANSSRVPQQSRFLGQQPDR
jgi:large conductance mechanosensitive channel